MNRDEAYAFLRKLAEIISLMFGKDCETVIHDMQGNKMVNLAIFNAHVSGRTEGSSLSIYGNETSLDTQSDDRFDYQKDYVNTLVILHGRKIKSSTIHMRGDDYHFALGINYDFSVMERMKSVLEGFSTVESSLITSTPESLPEIVDQCLETFSIPVEQMKKADRRTLVEMLYKHGAFNYQKSVPYVAEKIGVSKYTVYNYLKELEVEQ